MIDITNVIFSLTSDLFKEVHELRPLIYTHND